MSVPPITLIWNQSPNPICTVDGQGLISGANTRAAEVGLKEGVQLDEFLPELAPCLRASLAGGKTKAPKVLLAGLTLQPTFTAWESGLVITFPGFDHAAEQTRLRRVHQTSVQVMQAAAKLAKVGGWEVDLKTMQPRWSRETFRIHELEEHQQPTLDEAIQFYAPEVRDQVTACVERAIETGEGWDFELPLITAKGRRIWVRAQGRAEHKDGQAVRIFGAFQDLSEQHQQRLELQNALETAQEFESLFHTARAMVCTASEDGHFLRLNEEWTRTLGWTLEELMAQSFLHFVHPKDRARTVDEIQRLRPGGSTILHFENRYVCKDGSYRWLSWHSFTKADGGQFYAVALDVTQARRQREHQQRLAMAVSRTDNAVVVTDVQGRIEWVNDGFTRITGYGLDEVLGRGPGEVLHGEETDMEVVARMRTAIRSGQPFCEELLNYSKEGKAYWIEVDAQPMFNEDGLLQGFMAIERDISERRRRDAELVQAIERADREAQASMRASQAKSAFLASMSHEIRTPLNGVLGMAQILLGSELNGQQQDYAARILGSGRALMGLLDDILDFSKVEAGQLVLDAAPFQPRLLVDEVVELFQANAHAKDVVLSYELDPQVPEWLSGDPARLRQVLFNLVGNAVKFTAGGRVHVGIGSVGSPETPTLAISVSDTGIGIDADKLESIFHPFAQADASTTRRYGGTGLGLAISRQLVELMGGRISAESLPGKGSRFSVSIPLVACAKPQESTPPVLSGDGIPSVPLKAHVLVVEDNRVNQLVAVGMIRRLGGTTQVAENGAEAVACFKRERFDLILMDWHMPVMDGLDATRAIRAVEGAGRRTPILALTANAYDSQSQTCFEAGMDGVLTKPVDWHRLADSIAAWTSFEDR
jgi:PAS domain S-box-containing protein